jgi:Rod binding domain-containing protein
LAISLPSDIVLDVARAVEPDALETVRAKLASRAGGVMPSGAAEGFVLGDLRNSTMAKDEARTDATPESYKKFEAMVLSTFVQSMMPSETGAVYGEGMSGDMWKSLLAQQLGTVTSDRGGIGIADSLLKDHYVDGEQKVAMSGVSGGPDKARHDQERELSSALVLELQRRLTADIAGEIGEAADR